MAITFVGEHEEFEHIPTGFVSFDWALRSDPKNLGITTRNLVEVYGATGVGKTTIATSIAARLADKLGLGVASLDIEPQSPVLISQICNTVGYNGEWKWVRPKGAKTSDEYLLGALNDAMADGNIAILDSIGAISPVAEVEGDVGDRNIGARAFPMAQYSRGASRNLKYMDKPSFAFMTNHKYQEIATGLAFKTYDTPGGKVKNYLLTILLDVKIPYLPVNGGSKKQMHFETGWLLEGQVKKNRHGVEMDDFWLFVIGGHGVHLGLTAMFDCLKFGIAEWVGGKGITTAEIALKSTGESLGKVQEVIEKREELDFQPFYSALNQWLKDQGSDPVFDEPLPEFVEIEDGD